MKWNCNIVKEMYDRVLRRKFGVLCVDDKSNVNFIKSYINRLDCKPISLQCLDNSNLPCADSVTVFRCQLTVTVTVTIQVVDEQVQYVFTATPANGTAPFDYYWDWNYLHHWDYVSGPTRATFTEGGNVLILTPKQSSGTIDTNIALVVRDADECITTEITNVIYKGGCTDPQAVNYDIDATFDNGTCYYEELFVATNYTCEEDDTGTVCVTASGGTPPYTVVGTPNGTILTDGGTLCQNLPNGTNYSVYVVDSQGVTTTVQKGTIDCPFDCGTVTILPNSTVECTLDILGNNTGTATVTLTPSGGNAPYTITGTVNGNPGFVNGQTVNDNDVLVITVTDVNGCTAVDNITIDCPPPAPTGTGILCEDLTELNISVGMLIEDVDNNFFLGGKEIKYKVNYQFTNLGSFGLTIANIANIEYTITHTPAAGFISHYPSATPASPCLVCTDNISPIGILGQTPQYTALYSGGCTKGSTVSLLVVIKFKITVVMEDKVCVLCFEEPVNATWNCDTSTSIGANTLMNSITC